MAAQTRARDLGLRFNGTPGGLNAITDVPGVQVGHVTLIAGEGILKVGKGPVRTGVTAIFPRGKTTHEGVAANWFALNGTGEMTGTILLKEFGALFGPIMLTNTISVGTVRDAVIEWYLRQSSDRMSLLSRSIPVVAETWDGQLNDIYGFHVKKEHVFAALDNAKGGIVQEGNVGGGTGMSAYDFKAGIGTSSRRVSLAAGNFTVGVLAQANHGSRSQLRVTGAPVGEAIKDLMPEVHSGALTPSSIIIVVATDAPLLPGQLERLAKRAALGLARSGSIAENGSGDIFIAFSTANRFEITQTGLGSCDFIPHSSMSDLFAATVEATDESIINALVAAETMTGVNGNRIHALPHERLVEVLTFHRLINAHIGAEAG